MELFHRRATSTVPSPATVVRRPARPQNAQPCCPENLPTGERPRRPSAAARRTRKGEPCMFRKFWRRWQQPKSPTRAARRPGLTVEPLEERWMPTVMFKPVYGEEVVLKIGDGVMKIADVYPILW